MAKPAGYKVATYQAGGDARAGLIIGDQVFDAAALTGKPAYASVVAILADWKTAEGALREAAASVAAKKGKGSARKASKAAPKVSRSPRPNSWRRCAFLPPSTVPVRTMPTTPTRWRRATTGRRRPIRTRLGSRPGISSKPPARSPIRARG